MESFIKRTNDVCQSVVADRGNRSGVSIDTYEPPVCHIGATWLIQSNVPLAYVKKILGRSDVTTTMMYVHTAMVHLRDSLSRLDSFMGS